MHPTSGLSANSRGARANRLDPVGAKVITGKCDHRLNKWAGSACAKYADAFRTISLACRNLQFSRSSALI
jgi:hypothetical protein